MHLAWRTRCDILVIGAGLAGLRAARDCAGAGKDVIIAAKGSLCSGSSFYPLADGLGSQLPKDDADKDTFLEEVLDSSAGMADPELCRIWIEEIRRETGRLSEIGIEHGFIEGRAACFAKRERLLSCWNDWTKIRVNCRRIFFGNSNLRVFESCDLLRIDVRNGRVCGAVMCGVDGVGYVAATSVILASGGVCGLYRHSLNTPDVSGTGQSAALDAGAEMINAEFLQFIPGLTRPKYKLLFSETTLWYCVSMRDETGRDALAPQLPKGLSVHDCLMARSAHGPFTTADDSRFFDLAIMDHVQKTGKEEGLKLYYDPAFNTDPNPYVRMTREFYLGNGIDLPAQPISVLPFAHCANGGIRIDRDGRTSVPGLFAAGEAAGGVHGADRHGGAATAACLVFGARAAKAALRDGGIPDDGRAEAALSEAEAWLERGTGGETPEEILSFLQRELWYHAGILREEKTLNALIEDAAELRSRFSLTHAAAHGSDIRTAVQAYHALRTAETLARAMLARRESRGGHYRTDHPARNDEAFGKRIVIREAGRGQTAFFEDGTTI